MFLPEGSKTINIHHPKASAIGSKYVLHYKGIFSESLLCLFTLSCYFLLIRLNYSITNSLINKERIGLSNLHMTNALQVIDLHVSFLSVSLDLVLYSFSIYQRE